MNKQGVVTNEMLLAFKEQCKPFIQRMPYIYQGDQCLSNVKLETTLQYSNFSTLYLSITGVTTENTVVNTELLFRIKSNIWFGYGKNTGHSILTKAIIQQEEDNNVSLYLIFDKNISELIINTYAKNQDNISIFKVIDNSREVSSSNLPDNCKYISIDADTSNNRIGTIECLSGIDAQFSLITDKIENAISGELELETEPYQSGKLFDKIFSSKQTDQLGHNISIQYDYDNTLQKGESSSIGNLSNSVIKIPLPKLEDSNTDAFTSNGTVYGVIVEKGLVTSGTSDLPKATPDNLGAIKVTTDEDNGKEHYLHIKDDGIGYIKVESNYNQIIQVDLTKESADYNTNKQNYANVIYQHIGSTTEKYKNGYFYKCLKIYNGYITPSTYARYYQLDDEFKNDQAWIEFFINQYISKTKSTTSNLTSLALTVNKIEDDTSGVASELFFNIIENGGNTGIKGISYSQLCEDYKIAILDVNQIVNANNVGNYQFTVNLTDSGNYDWIQWDAQPRLIDTNAIFLRFRGTLEKKDSLKDIENPKPGDVYYIKEASCEYFYKQSDNDATFGSWEELGPIIDFPDYNGETRGLVPNKTSSNGDVGTYLDMDGTWKPLNYASVLNSGVIGLGFNSQYIDDDTYGFPLITDAAGGQARIELPIFNRYRIDQYHTLLPKISESLYCKNDVILSGEGWKYLKRFDEVLDVDYNDRYYSGSVGLVPVPNESYRDEYHYLTADGKWQHLHAATNSKLGAIMLGYEQNGQNYPVQLDFNQAYVNVPWTDTTYTAGNNVDITDKVISVKFPSFQSEKIEVNEATENNNYIIKTDVLNTLTFNSGQIIFNAEPQTDSTKTNPYHIFISLGELQEDFSITFGETFGTLKWQNGEQPVWTSNSTYELYIICNCVRWTEFK